MARSLRSMFGRMLSRRLRIKWTSVQFGCAIRRLGDDEDGLPGAAKFDASSALMPRERELENSFSESEKAFCG